jgi:hypothetical protein
VLQVNFKFVAQLSPVPHMSPRKLKAQDSVLSSNQLFMIMLYNSNLDWGCYKSTIDTTIQHNKYSLTQSSNKMSKIKHLSFFFHFFPLFFHEILLASFL